MPNETVSPKFQVAIPKEMRDALAIQPGQKMAMFNVNGTIRMVPVRAMREMRGFLKGLSSDGLREKRDRKV